MLMFAYLPFDSTWESTLMVLSVATQYQWHLIAHTSKKARAWFNDDVYMKKAFHQAAQISAPLETCFCMQQFQDHVWPCWHNWQAHTFRADGLLHLHVFPKQEAVNGAAHPKGIHTPAPCTSFLHLNAPKCLCLRITLQKVCEECLVKLLCSACGEDQAEEQEGNNPKKTIRWEEASTQFIFACREKRWTELMPLSSQQHVLATLHVHSFWFQATLEGIICQQTLNLVFEGRRAVSTALP